MWQVDFSYDAAVCYQMKQYCVIRVFTVTMMSGYHTGNNWRTWSKSIERFLMTWGWGQLNTNLLIWSMPVCLVPDTDKSIIRVECLGVIILAWYCASQYWGARLLLLYNYVLGERLWTCILLWYSLYFWHQGLLKWNISTKNNFASAVSIPLHSWVGSAWTISPYVRPHHPNTESRIDPGP